MDSDICPDRAFSVCGHMGIEPKESGGVSLAGLFSLPNYGAPSRITRLPTTCLSVK